MFKKVIAVLMFSALFMTTNRAYGRVADELYTEINQNGDVIDGNASPLNFSKPVIRPSYQGSSILKDYIGPEGNFTGYWGDDPGSGFYYSQSYKTGSKVIIKNVGFYKGKQLALTITFPNDSSVYYEKVSLTKEGWINIVPRPEGLLYRLVYDDGQYDRPVQGVYVELPMLSLLTAANVGNNLPEADWVYSRMVIPTSNLIRLVKNTDVMNHTKMVSKRMRTTFVNGKGANYYAEGLELEYQFSRQQANVKQMEQTFIFDNSEPLIVQEIRTLNYITPTMLFKSDMKTPGEINYLPPRTNGTVNSSKFEVNFDLTQAVNDGYDQYYPESLSLVMEDHENKFNALNIASATFTDQNGKDISSYMETSVLDDHQVAFKITKANLQRLKSNQINITLSADNLNSEEVVKGYDPKEKVYLVPVTFYNAKVYQGKKKESEKMIATAKITPGIYGEAVEGIEAEQYSTSGDLDKDTLLKNVATTIPSDTLTTEMVDRNIKFDTVKVYQVGIKITSQLTGESRVIEVPVKVTEAIPVTSAFFENQQWLIAEVNRQFASQKKKIDDNLYMMDLLNVTKIMDSNSQIKFTGQHIPPTIAALKNLEWLELWNKDLVGELPKEIGTLKKLHKLSVFGNQFSGGLPESYGELNNLIQLILDNNGLSGQLPASLSQLGKVIEIRLDKNQFVGQIPSFPVGQLSRYDVSRNQVTYNGAVTPDFFSRLTDYGNTLIVKSHNIGGTDYEMLSLSGIKELSVVKNGTTIKPFDSKDRGYFKLKISNRELFPEHWFTIINQQTGAVLYEGLADRSLTLTVNRDDSFKVVMDKSDKNPNNVIEIKAKPRELNLIETPKQLSLSLRAGDLNYEPVKITSKDSLTIMDNRFDSQWQIRLKPTALKNATQSISGSYYYKDQQNKTVEVPADEFKLIETGQSQPDRERISISDNWSQTQGLLYKQESTATLKGSYEGKLEWQLVDAPTD